MNHVDSEALSLSCRNESHAPVAKLSSIARCILMFLLSPAISQFAPILSEWQCYLSRWHGWQSDGEKWIIYGRLANNPSPPDTETYQLWFYLNDVIQISCVWPQGYLFFTRWKEHLYAVYWKWTTASSILSSVLPPIEESCTDVETGTCKSLLLDI